MKTYKQKDLKDCGLAVLQSVYHFFYKKSLSINVLKNKAFYSHDGINIANLEKLGKDFGLLLDSYGGSFDSLKTVNLSQPIIILINAGKFNHYVLITKITKKFFYLMDPLKGKIKISHTEMQKLFQNVVIFCQKDTTYKKKFEKKSWFNLWFFLETKSNWYLLFLVFLIAITNFISALFLRTVIDKVFPEKDVSLLIKVSLFFAWIVIWRIIQETFKKFYLHKIQLAIEKDIFDRFFFALKNGKNFHLLKLDNHDYIRRINLIPSFASFTANFYYHIFNEVTSFAISFLILLWIDWKMFVLIVGISIFYVIVTIFARKNLNKKQQVLIEKQLDSITSTHDLIFSIVDLKKEDIFKNLKRQFDDKYFKYKESEYSIWKKQAFLSAFNNFLFSLAPIAIVFVSSFWIFDKHLKIGDLLLFLSFFNFFINPLTSFVDIVTSLPIFLKEVELLNYVLNIDKEKSGNYHEKINDIKLQNVNVAYNGKPNLLYIKKFLITSNVKIVGKNGVGKSTFLKLLNQELEYGGQFMINNLDLNYYDLNQLRNRICYIKNEQYFPSIDVFSFITNNQSEKQKELWLNIQRFDLQDYFVKWQINPENLFINNGSNFSSGQKQIINLLKLLTQEFDLILLDEAFENIDSENFEVLKKIILTYQSKAIIIEVSHSKKFISDQGETIDIETLSKKQS